MMWIDGLGPKLIGHLLIGLHVGGKYTTRPKFKQMFINPRLCIFSFLSFR